MSEKLDALIKRMLEDPSSERIAFKALSERPDRAKFLEPLWAAGLFDPARNPAPKPAEQPGYVVVPFWSASGYLEKVAEAIGGGANGQYLPRLLQILEDVTLWRNKDGEPVDNYHTWYAFANVLASLPVEVMSIKALGLVESWLESKVERGLVAGVIGDRLLPKILQSSVPNRCELATSLVSAVTKLRISKRKVGEQELGEVQATIDSYHLANLFSKNADSLGKHCGSAAIHVLLERTRDMWEIDRDHPTYWRRPAIEDHEQNKHRDESFNALTSAVRDVLLSFAAADSHGARGVLAAMIASTVPLQRRIALHVIDVMYQEMSAVFWKGIKKADFIDLEVRHELYWLLKHNYARFTQPQRSRIFKYIWGVRAPRRKGKGISATDKAALELRVRRDWLHAIQGQGHAEADSQYQKLVSTIGQPGKYPDLLSYVETRAGPGPSPFPLERLLSEDCDDLVLLLNSFRETKGWDQPTLRALVDVLQHAAKQHPEKFVSCLPRFSELRIAYKYAIVNGLGKAFSSSSDTGQLEKILSFINREVRGRRIWDEAAEQDPEEAGLRNPSIEWFISSAADYFAQVAKTDSLQVDERYFEQALDSLAIILRKLKPEPMDAESSPLDHAINTARGRSIEALLGCALRMARDASKKGLTHQAAWKAVEPTISKELRRSGSNLDFIAIAGSMLPQLAFLNRDWLYENVTRLFDVKQPAVFRAAIVGFSYVNVFQKELYLLLRDKGILDHVLKQRFKEAHVREKILQFITVAYLHGDEDLQDAISLFRKVIDGLQEEDLVEVTSFLWAQRGDLGRDESMLARVMAYWEYCRSLLIGLEGEYGRVLSKLCLLAEYVPVLDEKSVDLLIQAAPYVNEDYNDTFLLKELHRLIQTNPSLGAKVVTAMFARYRPTFEGDDLVNLVEVLYESGQKDAADNICSVMKEFPRIRSIYGQRNP